MSLAAGTVYVAVDAALLADSSFMAVAVDRGVYASGDVPANQRLNDGGSKVGYVEIGASGEDIAFASAGSFDTDAADGTLTLTVRATSKRTALLLAKHVVRVLHGQPLPSGIMTADSQALVRGVVQFIEDFANPDGGHSAVLRYLTATVNTA